MIRQNEQIQITGVGVVSACGNTLQEFFTSLLIGGNYEKNIDFGNCVKFSYNKGILAEMPPFQAEERVTDLGSLALKRAYEDWQGNIESYSKTVCIIGSGMGMADELKNHVDEPAFYLSSLAGKITRYAGLNCESIYIGNACVSGSQAVSLGIDLLESGYCDLVFAGGVDCLSLMAYAGFNRLNAIDRSSCRPFDKNRAGISVGEGAVFFVLEKKNASEEAKVQNKSYATILSASVTNDAYHIVRMDPNGTEILRAMEETTYKAGIEKKDIDTVIAHGTGTILNDKTELKILHDFFGEYRKEICVMSVKGAIGHTGGAAGSFNILTAIGCIQYGKVPRTSNTRELDEDCCVPVVYGTGINRQVKTVMANTFAFGGTNIILLLRGHG